jgi:hypothetical protein
MMPAVLKQITRAECVKFLSSDLVSDISIIQFDAQLHIYNRPLDATVTSKAGAVVWKFVITDSRGDGHQQQPSHHSIS